MGVSFDVGAAMEALSQLQTGLSDGAGAADAAAQGLVRGTQSVAPVKTGHLRRSIHVAGSGGSGGRGTAVYGSNVVYAKIQNSGGVITVKTKKVLANKMTGEFFGKSVTIKGQQYMSRGRDAGLGDARNRLRAFYAAQFNG